MEARDRIIEGASQLFKLYGIKSVTMDTLASTAGISKRTLYEVFSDKDELLEGVLMHMADKQKKMIHRIMIESDNAVDSIFRMLDLGREHFQAMSPAFQADLKKYHMEVLIKKKDKCPMPDFAASIDIIEKGKKEKLFRKEINVEIVNRTLNSLGKMVMDNELFPFEEFTRKEVIKNVFINYLRGIATPEGLSEINKHDVKY
ncbi:MAG TPA: TetR/AcrR family transcriptional regulator [Bacteroidales bacterium]|nr:TetR/AcrR family transcriptional regulator [Bacteroidales bacterium]